MAPLDPSVYYIEHAAYWPEPTKELTPRASGPIRCLPKKSKTVTFKETATARTTTHINDYTAKEIRACWYSDSERSAIRKQVVAEAAAAADDESKVCPRGLEALVGSSAEQRREAKFTAMLAVLQEQELQRDEGSYDPEYIALAYKQCTACCRESALILGFNDQEEARNL